MPGEIAIRANSISKIYQIYEKPHDRLKQSLWRGYRKYYREFKALDDISFEVKRGETIGVIGCNGSGKSTLLQVICGTLRPTSGNAEVHGRVAALLELGAGFNPEFSGRENVYMNAAIYGISEEAIDAKYDKIVAFADIGDFIDQPVKTYSSGMYVRLAFAVIAHVDADILVIDEALAVGDAIFIQKCMRFLRSFSERGTLLFVSHDMASVRVFCERVLWLDAGAVHMIGSAKVVTEKYSQYCLGKVYAGEESLESTAKVSGCEAAQSSAAMDTTTSIDYGSEFAFFENIANSDGWKTGAAEIEHVAVLNNTRIKSNVFMGGENITLVIRGVAHRELLSPILGFFMKDKLGQSLFGEHTYNHIQPPPVFQAGKHFEARFDFILPLLPNGDYSITASVADGDPEVHTQHHWLHDAVLLKVSSAKLRYGLVGIPFKNVQLAVV